MPTSLVTGGAGFIGAHIVAELVRQGHKVVVLDDLSGGFEENIHASATFANGSVTDPGLIEALFVRHRFDYVYHLAAYAAEGLSHFIKRFNYTNNLIGSVNLINAAVKYTTQCFVFTSSIAVYGALTPPMREDMVPVPEDPYGIAKLAVEQDLRVTHEMFGLNYVIFRPHNVYGEYQNIGDRYRNVVGIFMNQLMQGQPLTVFGDGKQTRAFSYIGDIVPSLVNSAFTPSAYNQVFNIGADMDYSVNDLAALTMKAMGIKGEIRHLEARNEVVHAHADHAKVKHILGEYPLTSLPEGLSRMADWAKKAGVRKSKQFGEVEILKNIPPVWLED